MGTCLRPLVWLSFLFLSLLSLAQQVTPRPLITRPIDETQLTTLHGSTHPLARAQFDLGIAPPDLPMQRMLLVLKRDTQQDFALHKLLDDQQDKASPNYHKWLTPDQFGTQFGADDQDIQTVTSWLQSHGLQVSSVSRGKSVIEFSGTEAQVEAAFNTQIHQYLVDGENHWANSSDPQIPAALAPAVAGIRALNNFKAKRFSHVAGDMTRNPSTGQMTSAQPSFTLGGSCGVQSHCYGIGPYDFATIYDVANSWNAATPIDGTGQTIAIVGETDINPQDVADFRSYFGLPAYGQANGPALNIIHNGPAPGILNDGEETEADLDVQWSGAVAKGASVDFVVSQATETTLGIDLSALYIVDNNLAPVMSESYGICELHLGQAGNQFYNALWQQAAAQGITVMISSGDGGSAGCDNFDVAGPATLGLQVSGFASTPYNVAVGGTDFNDLTTATKYWSATNAASTHASALSYIPETTWDDNCTNPVFGSLGFSTNAEANCNNQTLINNGFVNIVSGSGGRSGCLNSDGVTPSSCNGAYAKPSWQVAPGVPSDGVRDVPDVSLYAASGSPSGSFYIVCEADHIAPGYTSCNASDPSTHFLGIGGTSASSPAFAGVMALVNQQTQIRQGNANFVLYKLAQQHPAVFHDVTTGTIAVPCLTGSPNCTTSHAGDQYGILSGYNAAASYDLATGIGSVDVGQLLQNWASATFRPSLTTLSLSPTTGLTHGQSVSVTASVAPSTGSGTPGGDVSLLTSTGVSVDGFTLSGGQITGNTSLLPGGTYTVTAHYAGDTTFGGSDSAPVSVTVGKENSSSQLQLETYDWQGNPINPSATTAVYGSPYFLRVNVLNSHSAACQPNPLGQAGCPTGSVNLTDNGSVLDAGAFVLNSLGYTEDLTIQLPGGSNSVKAQYPGDNSFNASSTTTQFNITPAATTMSASLFCGGCTVGSTYNPSATIQSVSSGVVPSGTVTFYANGHPISGTVSYSSFTSGLNPPTVTLQAYFFSSNSAFSTPGSYTITASYSGDPNYQPVTSQPTNIQVSYPSPVMSLQPSPSAVNAGSSATITANIVGYSTTIAPTGSISFLDLFGQQLSTPVSYRTVTDPATGNLELQGKVTIAPAYTDAYNAAYSGDMNYQSAQAAFATVTVNGNDFVMVLTGNTQPVIQRGGNAQVYFLDGFQSNTAPISFGSSACSGLPAETTCIVFRDPDCCSTGANIVTISTTGPHSIPGTKASAYRSQLFWAGSMLPFAAILLIGYRRCGTKRSLSRLLLTCLLLLGIACGGGSSNGGGGGGGGVTSPLAPTNLTATAASYNQINLNWVQPTTEGFTIYRGTTSGFTPSASNQLASYPPGNSPSYLDSGLAPSTTYYYVVEATNSYGSSGPSNPASATTQALDPGTPAGTYNITVTGKSGAISHSVNLTLIVQ